MIYFDNAYRTLGLHDGATRAEARALFHRLKIRSRMAGGEEIVDPLAPLGPVERDEAAVRDAFNLLGNVEERLRHRLFWFSNQSSRDRYALECMAGGDFKGAVEAWGSSREPGDRANLARLYHALAIARDINLVDGAFEIPSEYTWRDAIRTWREIIQSERFWEEFQAIEQASGFEPPALNADIYNLRQSVWDLLLAPSFTHVAGMVERGDFGAARDHIDELRDVGAAPRTVTAIELEGFASVIGVVANGIDEIMEEMNGEEKSGFPPMRDAYDRYRREIFPHIKAMVEQAGFNFEPTRQVCEKGVMLLQIIAIKSVMLAPEFARDVQEESSALREGGIHDHQVSVQSSTGSSTRRDWKSRQSTWWIGGAIWIVLVIIGASLRGPRYTPSPIELLKNRQWPESSTYTPPAINDSIMSILRDSSLLSGVDTSLLNRLDSIERTITIAVPEDTLTLENITARQRTLRKSLRALEALSDSLDEYGAKVNAYDPAHLARPRSIEDSLQRNVLERARGVWLKLYGNSWSQFNEGYKAYTREVKEINRDIREYNRRRSKEDRIEEEVVPRELVEGYERYRKINTD